VNRTAADFPTRRFVHSENIALLLRRENPTSVTERIVAVEPGLTRRKIS
jgi:hypothetical protein